MVTCSILAQDETPAVPPPGTGNGGDGGGFNWTLMIPMVLVFALLYFVMIRPQKKQERQRREMLSQMSKNARVVTIGGIQGIVYSVDEEKNEVVLKVDERNDVRIRVTRSAIARVLTDEDEESKPA